MLSNKLCTNKCNITPKFIRICIYAYENKNQCYKRNYFAKKK